MNRATHCTPQHPATFQYSIQFNGLSCVRCLRQGFREDLLVAIRVKPSRALRRVSVVILHCVWSPLATHTHTAALCIHTHIPSCTAPPRLLACFSARPLFAILRSSPIASQAKRPGLVRDWTAIRRPTDEICMKSADGGGACSLYDEL